MRPNFRGAVHTASMSQNQTPRLSVSTWSLHHHLGAPPITGPRQASPIGDEQKLLDLPSQLAKFGIRTLEICHFHLPNRDATFLDELRHELVGSGVELWALLIDDGDLNDPQNAARDQEWIESYLPVAAQLGAKTARVIAGKGAPTPENLAQSIAALRQVQAVASENGVRLTTENWFDLTSTPDAVKQIVSEVDGLGLCLDFGNWGGPNKPEKYAMLRQIAPLATSCHTKAFFERGELRREDFEACLRMMREVGFSGPHTLIYDSGGDEWRGLELEREVVAGSLA